MTAKRKKICHCNSMRFHKQKKYGNLISESIHRMFICHAQNKKSDGYEDTDGFPEPMFDNLGRIEELVENALHSLRKKARVVNRFTRGNVVST